MKALIRFTGVTSFEKNADLEALPDVGDFVRVKPLDSDEVFNGVVTMRTFAEKSWADGIMEVIIDVQQA